MKSLKNTKSSEDKYRKIEKAVSEQYLKFKYPLWILIFSFIFQKKITEIVQLVLVKPLFSSIEISTTALDYLFIAGFLLIMILLLYSIIKDYKISRVFGYWAIAISLKYAHYRYFTNDFLYVHLKKEWLQNIAYTDILLILLAALFIYYIVSLIRRFDSNGEVNSKDGFFTDIPLILRNGEDDINNSLEYIIELKDKILATDSTETSFAIGIIGKWGSGKTTFINTLEDLLNKEKKIIQLKFNPWMAGSPEKIIELFFSDLSTTLGKYDGNLKDKLLKYSKELLKSIDNNSVASIVKIFDKGGSSLSLVEQNKAISTSIESLKKRLIIYIDDVDRLDKKESIEVLRLIRNTANFKNTFFIVAFDRNYLLESIKDVLSGNIDNYIEKIFQLEYYLPINLNDNIWRDKFYDVLSNYVDGKQLSVLNILKSPTKNDFWGDIEEVLPRIERYVLNFRDVKRFLNVFLLNFNKIKDNIYLPDYISINILRLKFPEVYQELYYNRNKYLSSIDGNHFETNELSLIWSEKNEFTIEKTILYSFLDSNKSLFSLNEKSVSSVVTLVRGIFISKNDFYGKRTLYNNHLSVIDPSCFNRYFDFSLEGKLDQKDFESAFAGNAVDFISFITKTLSKGISTDLQISLENAIPTNRDNFEKLIIGILHFANSSLPNNIPNKIGFNDEKFLKLIGGRHVENNEVVNFFYNGNLEEFKSFIWQLLKNPINRDSTFYMFRFALYILKNSSEEFFISLQEIKNWCKSVFENFLKNESELTKELWMTYHKTLEIFKDNSVQHQEINNLFKDFIIKKDFIGFLKELISQCDIFDANGRTINEFYNRFFTDENEFINFIAAQTENRDSCNEFLNFFKEWKKSGDIKCVQGFEFKYLKK